MWKALESSQQKLYRYLEKGQPIWVLYLDIVKFHEIEFRHGNSICKKILEELEQEIDRTLKQQRNYYLLSLLESRGGDDFVVYFVPGENSPWLITDIIERWVLPLVERMNRKLNNWIGETIKLRSGVVLCVNESGRTADYLLYAAVKEAFLLNKSVPDPQYFTRRAEITHLLQQPENNLRTAFQPILQVLNGEVLGFEALSRINGTTSFSNIAELFPFAEKIGQLYPIETLCRRTAIASASAVLNPGELLFLNINPQVLSDPDFASGQTQKLLLQEGLSPSKVVLEITERSAIADFETFRQALAHYRNQGYLIALDDVGAGYSSLQSIAELHPEFLKIDRSLISGVNADPIKWAMLETFVTFSKRIGCRVLAEGVETEEEMRTVVQLGVDYVQGYYVAKPALERPELNPNSVEMLKLQRRIKSSEDNTILSLLEPCPLFDSSTLSTTVENFFRNQPKQWLIGVIENDRIVGVLQREKFFAALGTRFGVSLYSKRTISLLMDTRPLIVEDTTPIEVASSLAMERPDSEIYTGIVVVRLQKPLGMVPVASLMRAMAERQIQIARGANPLTGLPGNMLIDQELRQRLEQQKPFAVIYADLNQFKHYNDVHGFEQGDRAIKLIGEILLNEAAKEDENAFIGHIGGDDFIIILESPNLENCCRNILARFEQEQHTTASMENLSVSLAGLNIQTGSSCSTLCIAEEAARIKREAKKYQGNSFLIA
ncbi:MAG: EAL domain-containing protein [Desulfitobacteriaceae bacterium]